jgi:hypothetical protein
VPIGVDVALETTSTLHQADANATMWLFGSWARRGANAASDVDVLVCVSQREHIDEVRYLCHAAGVAAIVTDAGQLLRLPTKSPLLALHLSTEAIRLVGDHELPDDPWHQHHQHVATRRALSRMESARHEVSVWGASDSAAQTRLFAAAKEWAMLHAALNGRPQFDRWSALEGLGPTDLQRHALEALEAVWMAKRAGSTPPKLTDPDLVTSAILNLVPIASRA